MDVAPYSQEYVDEQERLRKILVDDSQRMYLKTVRRNSEVLRAVKEALHALDNGQVGTARNILSRFRECTW